MTVSDSNIQPKQDEKNGFITGCFEWVEALITALIAVMVLFVFFFRLNVVVQGPSMEPNYMNGYRVFVNCVDRKFTGGDVVVIDADGTHLPQKERIIKRVIATEGQKVNIDFINGYVFVNDKKLDESAYIQNGITKVQGNVQFPLTVPKGKLFVLGDNRPVSQDSRYDTVGFIDARYVMGKVPFLLSPFRGFSSK
ncbi:MAG TPA: signal peptidase I [Caproicibacter sp.]|nr:signal peptidase I [Caproicibacter sp.]